MPAGPPIIAALFAWLHFLAIGVGAGLLLTEYWLCRRMPDRIQARLLGQVDLGYQLALIAALATGLSRFEQTLVQLKGVVTVGVFTFAASMAFWFAVKAVMGLRVSPEEELEGLDVGEHGNVAYPDFQTSSVFSSGGVGAGHAAAAAVRAPGYAGNPT